MDLTVSVVIAAYNEKDGIASVIAGLRCALEGKVKALEVIVVDDGSSDGTHEAVDPKKATLIRHPKNGGYGRSLRTGIEAARHDWVLMIDGDGSYPPEEAAKLLDYAPRFDLVIGKRSGSLYWGSPLKALMRWIYLSIAEFIVGEPVPDANSGLRLVRRSLVSDFGLVQCLGYSFSTTMTLSFLKSGRFVAFPDIRFEKRTGSSKVHYFRDVIRTLQLMTEIMLVYNPMKLFVTLAAGFLYFALLLLALFVVTRHPLFLLGSVPPAMAALLCFSVGCILDSIRMHYAARNPPKAS